MSLAVLADHMASRGRGPDSMLIHMSPREVQGLQALAMKHGGSLTINPETGLPEAGFLDKLLPTIIGAGISYFSGGTIDPKTAAMIVGGVQTARTGDIGKGIQAGLGAYGGASLTSGMTAAGADAISTPAAGDAYAGLGANAITDAQALAQGFGSAEELMQTKAALAGREAVTAAGPFESLSQGFDAAKKAGPMQYLKANAMPLAAAFGPAILAGQSAKDNMPKTTTGMINPFTFDPYSGTYTSGNPYQATPTRGAEGGLMGMDNGGYGPGQLDFTQRSEPVVRMASGGMPRFAGADRSLINSNAYEDRDVFSTGANNNLSNQQVKAPDPLADLYQSVLGRAPESQDVRDYWGNQFKGGATPGIDPDEITTFQGAARGELLANLNATRSADNQLVNDPNSVTGLTRPAETLTPAEGIAAIAAKQASDAKIANANLAALQPTKTADTTGTTTSGELSFTPNNATTTTGGGLATLANATGATTTGATGAGTTTTGGGLATLASTTGATTTGRPTAEQAAATIATIYRNVLGRDPDPNGMAYWTQQLTSGAIDSATMYTDILKGAQANKETGNFGLSFADAQKGYTGYSSADASNIADEWVRNVLGREVTDADRKTQWYKDAVNKEVMNTYAKAENIYNNFRDYAALQTGSPAANLDLYQASKLMGPQAKTTVTGGGGNDIIVPSGYHLENGVIVKNIDATQRTSTVVDTPTSISTADRTALPVGVSGAGVTTINPNSTVSTRPDIPGIPEGGFTGVTSLRKAYEEGGGSLGVNKNLFVPKTTKEIEDRYKLTGGSKQSYDYLTGKTKYSPVPYTETGEIMKPYGESVLGIPANSSKKMYIFKNGKYEINPDYAIPTYDKEGKKSLNLTNQDVINYVKSPEYSNDDTFVSWMTANNLSPEQIAAATGMSIADVYKKIKKATPATTTTGATTPANLTDQSKPPTTDPGSNNEWLWDYSAKKWYVSEIQRSAAGGLMAYGGMAQQFDLGGYSDGGRLLRGPGDGVSDSIPATIGNKRPARLADGEFVVPARIVSELGNGSTEAGARKLYAMMDRVQSARRGTVGKGRVAKNSRSEKYLPA